VILAPNNNNGTAAAAAAGISSRYVATAATDYLQAPEQCRIVAPTEFDSYAGAAAVHTTIQHQKGSEPDPYAPYAGTCNQGDVPPLLPRFQLLTSKNRNNQTDVFQFDYSIWSFPDPTKDPLYKLWPILQKHNAAPDGASFIKGPYCYGMDPKRGYQMDLSYNTNQTNNSWSLVQGCVQGLPCWTDDYSGGQSSNSSIPSQNGGVTDIDLNKALLTYGCYFLLLGLIVSLTCNCQLSHKLKRLQRRHHPHHAPIHSNSELPPPRDDDDDDDDGVPETTTTTEEALLQEPLLPAGAANKYEPEEVFPSPRDHDESVFQREASAAPPEASMDAFPAGAANKYKAEEGFPSPRDHDETVFQREASAAPPEASMDAFSAGAADKHESEEASPREQDESAFQREASAAPSEASMDA
jgi:hypothetical protein